MAGEGNKTKMKQTTAGKIIDWIENGDDSWLAKWKFWHMSGQDPNARPDKINYPTEAELNDTDDDSDEDRDTYLEMESRELDKLADGHE